MPMNAATVNMTAIEESIADLNRDLADKRAKAVALAQDRTSNMEDVRVARQAYEDVKDRLALMQEERDRLADEAAFRLRKESNGLMSKKEAAGMFFRAALTGGDVRSLPQMAYEQLGMIPAGDADQGNGSVLVPTTLATELLTEPMVRNPLRQHMRINQVPNLIIPRLGFGEEDDSFLTKDGESAKEIQLRGDSVTFGTYDYSVKAKVAESILRTTNLNVEAEVTSGLHSSAASKELKVIFATEPKGDEKHMSLYQKKASGSETEIKMVTGDDLYSAYLNAFADLEDAYRDTAAGCMRYSDYVTMLRALSPNASLFDAAPERVLGKPVMFTERCVTPVVGDWRYLYMNFACAPWYDTDKDPDKRYRRFFFNALYDIQVLMFSAFRLIGVKPSGVGAALNAKSGGAAINAGGENNQNSSN